MIMKILVAICQIFILDGDRLGNLARIEHALVDAKAKGAAIACFPEMSLYGWVNPDAYQRACPIPGKDSDALCALAKKYQITMCVGLAEKEGEALHDSVVLIDDQGKILLKHRKINILTELMKPPYTPGKEIQVVDTPLGRIGLLICADTFLNDNLDRMKALEPDLLLVPYGWAAEETAWPEHGKRLEETVSRAAQRVGVPLVGTDSVGMISHGPWTGRTYGGQSVVANEKGEILTILADRDREVQVVEIRLPARRAGGTRASEVK